MNSDELINGAIAIGVLIVALGGAYWLYENGQQKAATAQSVALNNEAFSQQVHAQEAQTLLAGFQGSGPATNQSGVGVGYEANGMLG